MLIMFDITFSLVITQVILLSVQALLYFGIQVFEGPAHEIYTKLDEKIPYAPQTIFIYALWFPLVMFFPLFVHHFSAALYLRHMIALVLDIVLSCIIYLVYPTSFARPKPPGAGLGRLMRFVYRVDFKGKNCMPSMHCSMCFLMIFSTIAAVRLGAAGAGLAGMARQLAGGGAAEQLSMLAAVCIIIVCLLIVASTVLTKQHVIVDVVTGLIMAVVCWILAPVVAAMIC